MDNLGDIDHQLRSNIRLAQGRKTVRFAEPARDPARLAPEVPRLAPDALREAMRLVSRLNAEGLLEDRDTDMGEKDQSKESLELTSLSLDKEKSALPRPTSLDEEKNPSLPKMSLDEPELNQPVRELNQPELNEPELNELQPKHSTHPKHPTQTPTHHPTHQSTHQPTHQPTHSKPDPIADFPKPPLPQLAASAASAQLLVCSYTLELLHRLQRLCEPVNELPVKRVYYPKSHLLRETPKMRRDFELDPEIPQAIFKVKLAAVNFQTDFTPLKGPIVPGLKLVGKIWAANVEFDPLKRYLLFPFSSCLMQRAPNPCGHCAHLANLETLGALSYEKFRQYRCLGEWTYGVTIDGGLQDYMKIPSPMQSLVEVDPLILLHDCCFMFERLLPLFVVLKHPWAFTKTGDRILMVLLDMAKEINDVLLVLDHYGMDRTQVVFMDKHLIAALLARDRLLYREAFKQLFVFDTLSRLLEFANYAMYSLGLQLTRDRYNVFIFDQHHPLVLAHWFPLVRAHDKRFHQVKLAYHHREDAAELMLIIAARNQAQYTYSKQTRFDKRPAWLHYDKDFDLKHDYHDDQKSRAHTLRHINHYLRNPKYSRVCYNTRVSTNPDHGNVIIL